MRRVVARYRDEPAILAWMLMNEAESRWADGGVDAEALYTFAEGMSRLVKQLDPKHLVPLGVIGRGQPGTAGPSFERLHAPPTIDLVTFHDYLSDDTPLPRDLAAAATTAAVLNKPLLVTEAGLATCTPAVRIAVHTPDQRAALFGRKIEAFFRAGGAGYLVWTWDPESPCGYDFTSGDPLNGVLRAAAARLTPR